MLTGRGDRELLGLLRDPGERESAFRALADRYTPRLLGFLRTYFRDSATAEDIVQQVFLTLLREPPEEGLDPWLLRTARNRALHEKRRQKGRPTVSEIPDRPAEAAPEPGDAVRLREAILSLPETYREILVLHRYKGLRYEQIAPIVGTTPGSARVLMHKALDLLRKKLSSSR